MKKFIFKKVTDRPSSLKKVTMAFSPISSNLKNEEKDNGVDIKEVFGGIEEKSISNENNVIENTEVVMDTKEKINIASSILNIEQPKVKKIKRDKGLIEKTDSSSIILTEDNRELLND